MVSSIGASLFSPFASGTSANAGRQSLLAGQNELTEEEEKQVQDLKARDQEVRAHENAHKTAGGGYVGSISYETQTGPDGREYAIGGEAQIDASGVPGNPEATIRKMDIVIRAALAPAEPSSQDYAVARSAQQARLEAQRELSEERRAEKENDGQNAGGLLSNLALLNEERTAVASDSAGANASYIAASNVIQTTASA
jgi:hypothetical protein